MTYLVPRSPHRAPTWCFNCSGHSCCIDNSRCLTLQHVHCRNIQLFLDAITCLLIHRLSNAPFQEFRSTNWTFDLVIGNRINYSVSEIHHEGHEEHKVITAKQARFAFPDRKHSTTITNELQRHACVLFVNFVVSTYQGRVLPAKFTWRLQLPPFISWNTNAMNCRAVP